MQPYIDILQRYPVIICIMIAVAAILVQLAFADPNDTSASEDPIDAVRWNLVGGSMPSIKLQIWSIVVITLISIVYYNIPPAKERQLSDAYSKSEHYLTLLHYISVLFR